MSSLRMRQGLGLAGVAALGVWVVVLVACSGNETEPAATPDAGFKVVADGAPTTIEGGVQSPACKPADVSNFVPDPYHAARPQPNSCTLEQANEFYADCLANGTSTYTCDPFIGVEAGAADQACAACIVSRDTDPTYGPVIMHDSWVELNLPGCIEVTQSDDPNALDCAKSSQAASECEDDACKENCPITPGDAASLGAYQACTNVAASVGCGVFSGPGACTSMYMAGASAACFAGNSIETSFAGYVMVFCGPQDGGVLPSDASAASDGAIADARDGGDD